MLALTSTQGIIIAGVGVALIIVGGAVVAARGRRRAEAPDIPNAMRPGPSDPDLETPLLYASGVSPWSGIAELRGGSPAELVVTDRGGRVSALAADGSVVWRAHFDPVGIGDPGVQAVDLRPELGRAQEPLGDPPQGVARAYDVPRRGGGSLLTKGLGGGEGFGLEVAPEAAGPAKGRDAGFGRGAGAGEYADARSLGEPGPGLGDLRRGCSIGAGGGQISL